MVDDFRTRTGRQGQPLKAGLNMHEEGAAPSKQPMGGIYRAIVLETYATDDGVRTADAPGTERTNEVECDIVLVRSLIPYRRVPVAQNSHGHNNASPWIPKGSDHVIEGGVMNLRRTSRRGSPEEAPSALADFNGDHVLVQFIEGDPEAPVITGGLTHTHTRRLVKDGSGWSEGIGGNANGDPGKDERYLRYGGTEVRINSSGDLLVDTEEANPLDEEAEVPSVNGGLTRLRLKRGQVLTVEAGGVDVLEIYSDLLTGEVHIDLGEGASERLVRGNRLVKWLGAHIHPTGVGPAGPPPPAAGGETIEPISGVNASFLSRLHKIEDDSDGELP